jgi:hypothetical protein
MAGSSPGKTASMTTPLISTIRPTFFDFSFSAMELPVVVSQRPVYPSRCENPVR